MRPPILVDRVEAAEILGVSRRAFSRILSDYYLPVERIENRRKLYRRSAVRFLKQEIKKNAKQSAAVLVDGPADSIY